MAVYPVSFETTVSAVLDHVAYCNVTGTLSPDAVCNYEYVGEYAGWPLYQRFDGAYHLWRKVSLSEWRIGVTPGESGDGYWYRSGASMIGNYSSYGTFTGTATVAMGSH